MTDQINVFVYCISIIFYDIKKMSFDFLEYGKQ